MELKDLQNGDNTLWLNDLEELHVITLNTTHLAIIYNVLKQSNFNVKGLGSNYINVELTPDETSILSTTINRIIDDIIHGKYEELTMKINAILDTALDEIKNITL